MYRKLIVLLCFILVAACSHQSHKVSYPHTPSTAASRSAPLVPDTTLDTTTTTPATTTTTVVVPTTKRVAPKSKVKVATPVVPAAPVGYSGSGCPYASQILSAFGSVGPRMVQIAMRESRCIPTAHNPSGASGLFQIMMPMHRDKMAKAGCSNIFDASCNIATAVVLYHEDGLAPWGG